MYVDKSMFLFASRRLQDAQDGSKTFQDGANTVSNVHKAPSKGVVDAYSLKDIFLADVYS